MKGFNGFKTVLMASIVMPMALVGGYYEELVEKHAYKNKKAWQLLAGWTALSLGSFAAKKACERLAAIPKDPIINYTFQTMTYGKQYLRAARVFKGISGIAAVPALTIVGAGLYHGMVAKPAEMLANKKYASLQNKA